MRNRGCDELNRGSQNLDSPGKGERIVTFCVVQKVTKKHVLGRAKSCQWQVFVRRRPPKQGELRTDVSKATMFQGDGAANRVAAGNQKGGTAAKHRRKAEISREAAKGFNWIARSCLLCAATSRFAKPRSFLKKVLIVAVRSCGCGVLIRGLQNLGTSCKGDVFTFFLRRAKRTKKHARGLRTSGLRGRFKSPVDTVFLRK